MKKAQTKTSKKAAKLDSNMQTIRDLKSSILVVSILINAFILTGWVALQVTRQYDSQVATLLHIL